MTTSRELSAEAERLAELLREKSLKIVFAESCTAGLVSATLGRFPGISDQHCGSAVVYRIETKAEWLGISRATLDSPGPVSRIVAEEMARRVLERTPEADVAASITGHLGPNAPKRQDGLVYVGFARRLTPGSRDAAVSVIKRRFFSDERPATPRSAAALRVRRQRAAAALVLSTVSACLAKRAPSR